MTLHKQGGGCNFCDAMYEGLSIEIVHLLEGECIKKENEKKPCAKVITEGLNNKQLTSQSILINNSIVQLLFKCSSQSAVVQPISNYFVKMFFSISLYNTFSFYVKLRLLWILHPRAKLWNVMVTTHQHPPQRNGIAANPKSYRNRVLEFKTKKGWVILVTCLSNQICRKLLG